MRMIQISNGRINRFRFGSLLNQHNSSDICGVLLYKNYKISFVFNYGNNHYLKYILILDVLNNGLSFN